MVIVNKNEVYIFFLAIQEEQQDCQYVFLQAKVPQYDTGNSLHFNIIFKNCMTSCESHIFHT